MATIYYKFSAHKSFSTITFDGLGLTLRELKRKIAEIHKFDNNNSVDLEIYNAQTNEGYTNLNDFIYRNTSVIVKRVPSNTKPTYPSAAVKSVVIEKASRYLLTEQEKLNQVYKTSGQEFKKYAGEQIFTKKVPPNYICYRCYRPGHFITDCPVTERIRRPTGIPKVFLKKVEDGANTKGAMLLPDGTYAVSTVNDYEWDKHLSNLGGIGEELPVPVEFQCSLCTFLLSEVVDTPCCGQSFCDSCIRNYLLENNFKCPGCNQLRVSPDKLTQNKVLRQKIVEYQVSNRCGKNACMQFLIDENSTLTSDYKNQSLASTNNEKKNPNVYINTSNTECSSPRNASNEDQEKRLLLEKKNDSLNKNDRNNNERTVSDNECKIRINLINRKERKIGDEAVDNTWEECLDNQIKEKKTILFKKENDQRKNVQESNERVDVFLDLKGENRQYTKVDSCIEKKQKIVDVSNIKKSNRKNKSIPIDEINISAIKEITKKTFSSQKKHNDSLKQSNKDVKDRIHSKYYDSLENRNGRTLITKKCFKMNSHRHNHDKRTEDIIYYNKNQRMSLSPESIEPERINTRKENYRISVESSEHSKSNQKKRISVRERLELNY